MCIRATDCTGRTGVVQVPRYEARKRQALTAMMSDAGNVGSGFAIANINPTDEAVSFELRVDVIGAGNIHFQTGAFLVGRYAEKVYQLADLWPGLQGITGPVQVSVIFQSANGVVPLGATFYGSCGQTVPSYFYAVELKE